MFTGSYQRPKNDIQTGCEGGKKKKTDTGRDRGKDVRSNNGEKARDNSGIDRLPVGDTILCVNKKKKNHCYRLIPRAKVMGFSEGNVGAKICDTHTSRTTNY